MLEKIAPALIGLAGTFMGAFLLAIGWFITHTLTVEREIAAKRREQHLTYLIPAYRTLAKMIPYNKAKRLEEVDEDFQKAIADIQFFGSSTQIQLVKTLIEDLVEHGIFNPEPLLTSLRDDLRKELGKEKVSGPIKWISLLSATYKEKR
jgi:hypothetical protein